jgi:hypothetical protein
MMIPTALIPACPDEGSEVTMNLRSNSFVDHEGWHLDLSTGEDYDIPAHEGAIPPWAAFYYT